MSIEALSTQLTEVSEVFPGLTFNDFILGALQRGVVDPINATRLQAANDDKLIDKTVASLLWRVTKDYDDEPVPDQIIAPLLRDMSDFADEQTVMIQESHKSPWHKVEVFAIDQLNQTVVIDTRPRVMTEINPMSISMFNIKDYETLEKPEYRRQRGAGLTLRFALGLSAYDKEYAKNSDLKSLHRHFDLIFKHSSFEPLTDRNV